MKIKKRRVHVEKQSNHIPKSIQQAIPLLKMFDDGIFCVGKNQYAKNWKFADINYTVAGNEEKETMFLKYAELLNALDSGVQAKLTIVCHRLNRANFEHRAFIAMREDSLDDFRREYNEVLMAEALGSNAIVQDKYITVSVNRRNISEAKTYFTRFNADISNQFTV